MSGNHDVWGAPGEYASSYQLIQDQGQGRGVSRTRSFIIYHVWSLTLWTRSMAIGIGESRKVLGEGEGGG